MWLKWGYLHLDGKDTFTEICPKKYTEYIISYIFKISLFEGFIMPVSEDGLGCIWSSCDMTVWPGPYNIARCM